MSGIRTSYVTYDATKMANMLAALNAQNVTNVKIPVKTANGTIVMQTVDMTLLASMSTAMQNAGMTVSAAASTANVMMSGMR